MTAVLPLVDSSVEKSLAPRLNPLLLAGLAMMLILIVVAILAPVFLGDTASKLSADVRQGPSPEHLLGTDEFGRDLLARSLVSTQLTLSLAASASALSIGVGIAIGTAVWMLPGRLRNWILTANNVAVAFPTLVLALIIAAILGAGAWSAMLAIGIAGIPAFVRLTANIALPIVVRDFVATAGLLQVPRPLIILRHVLPNMAEPLLILSASHFAIVLMELSGLSFIGLGVQSPHYDYGKLLSDGLISIYSQPTQIVGPAVMIIFAGLAAMLIGDGLAVRSNPRVTQSGKKAVPSGRTTRDAAVPSPLASSPMDNALVTVRNLRVTTDTGTELVKGISFDLRPGEILGLVGESGSGKSLTAMSLAGLVPGGVNCSATVLDVAGHDMLASPAAGALARDIALIYQDPVSTFNPALRLGDQLTEVARTHLGMSKREARKALLSRFEQLGITEPARRLNQHPFEMSGGMLQRAMISSAMLADAKLIIADEPTTALDVTVQANVLREFYWAASSVGASVLFISHDLGVVEALCDRVLVMNSGEIVEELSIADLAARQVKHPYTRKLLNAALYLEA